MLSLSGERPETVISSEPAGFEPDVGVGDPWRRANWSKPNVFI
jgi:hypothetical protein